jgi:predicted XRE-type DNA-binding protein
MALDVQTNLCSIRHNMKLAKEIHMKNKKYDDGLIDLIIQLKNSNYSSRSIAAFLRVSKSGINDLYNRKLKEHKEL